MAYVFIIFSQHADHPLTIEQTGTVKGFARSLTEAKTVLKEVVTKEHEEDATAVHGVAVQYQAGPSIDKLGRGLPMWTLVENDPTSTFERVANYCCVNGHCTEDVDVAVDDFDDRARRGAQDSSLCQIM